MLDFAFVTIMTNQYTACTRGDHKSRCIRDLCAIKEQIARKVKLENLKFEVTVVLMFFVTD